MLPGILCILVTAIGFLLAGPAGEKILPGNLLIGSTLLWIAALLTLYTGYDYFRAGLKHVIDEDGHKEAGS